jgi:hypothetical protein
MSHIFFLAKESLEITETYPLANHCLCPVSEHFFGAENVV